MKKIIFLSLIILFAALNQAQAGDRFAVAAKAGTLGGGVDAIFKLNDHLNTRVGGNFASFDYEGEEGDIDYDFDVDLMTAGALLDWFPFSNGFRMTGGVMLNQNELDATAQSSATYTIDNTTYTGAQVGTLTGNIDFMEAAPYAGIGWGQPFGKESNWSFNVDLGVMFQGSLDVDLSADGPFASNPTFMADLEREEDDLEDDLEKYQFYPVVALGVTYRF